MQSRKYCWQCRLLVVTPNSVVKRNKCNARQLNDLNAFIRGSHFSQKLRLRSFKPGGIQYFWSSELQMTTYIHRHSQILPLGPSLLQAFWCLPSKKELTPYHLDKWFQNSRSRVQTHCAACANWWIQPAKIKTFEIVEAWFAQFIRQI